MLDLSNCPQGAPLAAEYLQRAAEPGGGVQPGDIALFYFGWERRGGELPYPATEALQWLVDRGIKLLGIDIPGDRRLPNHHLLFANGFPLIEWRGNLDQLQQPRVYVFAQPLPATQTDAIPLRVLAFEG